MRLMWSCCGRGGRLSQVCFLDITDLLQTIHSQAVSAHVLVKVQSQLPSQLLEVLTTAQRLQFVPAVRDVHRSEVEACLADGTWGEDRRCPGGQSLVVGTRWSLAAGSVLCGPASIHRGLGDVLSVNCGTLPFRLLYIVRAACWLDETEQDLQVQVSIVQVNPPPPHPHLTTGPWSHSGTNQSVIKAVD